MTYLIIPTRQVYSLTYKCCWRNNRHRLNIIFIKCCHRLKKPLRQQFKKITLNCCKIFYRLNDNFVQYSIGWSIGSIIRLELALSNCEYSHIITALFFVLCIDRYDEFGPFQLISIVCSFFVLLHHCIRWVWVILSL